MKDAIEYYNEVVELHFDDITGDDALYNLAVIYDRGSKRFMKKLKSITLSFYLNFQARFIPLKQENVIGN